MSVFAFGHSETFINAKLTRPRKKISNREGQTGNLPIQLLLYLTWKQRLSQYSLYCHIILEYMVTLIELEGGMGKKYHSSLKAQLLKECT